MIKSLLLFYALVIGSAVAAPAPTPKPEPAPAAQQPGYFFNIELDPHYQFVGVGALTEEDAAKSSCYRFVYNSDGKLQQIAYQRAGNPMPNPLLGVSHIDFEYQPGIERRWFRGKKGKPVHDVDGIYGEELTLNAAGYPTDITNLDDSGGKMRDNIGVIHYVRTLDDHNRVVSLRRLGLLGTAITDDGGFFETRTAYDEQGRPIERGNYDASGNLLANNDGVALTRMAYTLFPDATQTTKSFFDASAMATEEKGNGVHQVLTTVDQRGFTTDESYFDLTGAPMVTTDDGIHERRYTFDDRGDELTEEFFDANGKPVDRKPVTRKDLDFARVVYKYDDKNRVIETAYFGSDGKPQIPINLGAAFVRQEYDDEGNIAHLQFFDGLGHPSSNMIYGAPAIRIKVDGDRTIVTLRDEKDQPAKNPVQGYYAFSYKTATERPLAPTNLYYDAYGHELSYFPRISVINPHLRALNGDPDMQWSARLGAAGAGLGSLLACLLALRKSSHTKRRKVYVPTPVERFLGWFSVFAILEGCLRFFMTVYWAWVGYQNGKMGYGVYVLETLFILFFLYRLYRLRVTMRVLNIARADVHGLVRDFFAKVNLKPEWIERQNRYVTPPLDIRVNFYEHKNHAYLGFKSRGAEGRKLEREAAEYIRAQAGGIQAPVRTRAIALYYPSVAFCYFLLAGTAFYTLYQLLKGF